MRKNTHRLIVLFSTLTSFLIATPSVAEPVSIRAEVNGMVCAFCAQGIDARLRKNKASKEVYVNLKNRVVVVELKDGQTFTLDAFTADVTESGHTVTKVEFVNEPLSTIRATFKK
jgi:cation transport ATPase